MRDQTAAPTTEAGVDARLANTDVSPQPKAVHIVPGPDPAQCPDCPEASHQTDPRPRLSRR